MIYNLFQLKWEGGGKDPEIDQLSNILKTFNDRYGTEFEDADKVRKMVEDIVIDGAENIDLQNSLEHSDEQNARITSDKVAQEELLKYVTTNFDFYKVINDNTEAKEEFNSLFFGMVKEIWKNRNKEKVQYR